MVEETRQEDVTLLDVLIDGFEKNEIMYGFHWRSLPMPDEASAIRKFISLAAEATAWKGQPVRQEHEPPRRIVAWADLEIRQIGRGIMVRVPTPRFDPSLDTPASASAAITRAEAASVRVAPLERCG